MFIDSRYFSSSSFQTFADYVTDIGSQCACADMVASVIIYAKVTDIVPKASDYFHHVENILNSYQHSVKWNENLPPIVPLYDRI